MGLEEDIQSRFANPRHKLIVNALYTGSWMTKRQTEFFKTYGISLPQFNILRILRGQGEGGKLTVGAIKERMIDPESNVSRLVETMRKKKLLKRLPCRNDRRVAHVFITEEGLQLLADIDKEINSLENIVSHMTDEEVISLNKLLDKMRTDAGA